MPTTQFVTIDSTFAGVAMQNVFAYYTASVSGSAALQTQVLAEFLTEVLPLWQAWLPSSYEFTGITVRSSNFPVPSQFPLNEVGALTIANNLLMPPWLPLYCRVGVLQNLNGADGLPYTGMRPIRGGGHYFSGCPEAWNTATGYVNPGDAPGLAFEAFLDQLDVSLVVTLATLMPVVWGSDLPAAGSKPARDVVVAPVDSVLPREFTRLKSRKA